MARSQQQVRPPSAAKAEAMTSQLTSQMTSQIASQRQSAETTRLHAQVDFIHRYWLREFGCYPDHADSMTIIGVIAALDEMASLPPGRVVVDVGA